MQENWASLARRVFVPKYQLVSRYSQPPPIRDMREPRQRKGPGLRLQVVAK
jgi:hypothetical protein